MKPCRSVIPASVGRARHATNHVQAALSGTGELCVFVSVAMHVVVDMSGWFGAAATTRYFAVEPYRAVDTRSGLGMSGAFAAGANRSITLAPSPSPNTALPSAAVVRAIFAIVTAVRPTAVGYLTVHPCSSPVPAVSMVRFVTTDNAANGVAAVDDASGRWCVFASVSTHMVLDVNGYFA